MVRQRSISTQVFLPNIELGNSEGVSLFADNFQDKNVGEIFQLLMTSILSMAQGAIGKGAGLPDYVRSFDIDWTPFLPKIVPNPDAVGPADQYMPVSSTGGFQHNFMSLMTLFLMTITNAANREYFPKRPKANPASASYYGAITSAPSSSGLLSGGAAEPALRSLSVAQDDTEVPLSPFGRAFVEPRGSPGLQQPRRQQL